jgi:HEPN domain-containing protein
MKTPFDFARSLLQLADRDINAFHALIDDKKWGVDQSIICFHAQQATEKALKAVLASRNLEIGRTHDLSKLAYEIEKIPLALPVDIGQLAKLNPYAVMVRYDEQEINTISLAEAEEVMNGVRSWAEKNITEVQ